MRHEGVQDVATEREHRVLDSAGVGMVRQGSDPCTPVRQPHFVILPCGATAPTSTDIRV
jgi:hypothetical protein